MVFISPKLSGIEICDSKGIVHPMSSSFLVDLFSSTLVLFLAHDSIIL
jgi:hypothetical protein